MRITIASLFPELHGEFSKTSLVGRAINRGSISFATISVLTACRPKERVDAPTFGHRAGMAIRPDVVARVCDAHEQQWGRALRIFFSPRGKKLTQTLVRTIATAMEQSGNVLLFAGRYEGIDARAEEAYADIIVSIGDYVLMGGDLPAQVLLEATLRYIPGIVQRAESVAEDSFSGPFVDAPAYTAPAVWRDRAVPDVIRSGDHARMYEWERTIMVADTIQHHFDWLRAHPLSVEERQRVMRSMPKHYVALMHTDVLLPHQQVGTTSVTSLDIHDIARSARTYGLQGYFIVTPLVDQQKIVETLLGFWRHGDGVAYNPDRCDALQRTHLVASYQDVIDAIVAREGQEPVVIATSAQHVAGVRGITYHDQELVWSHNRPVLFLLGTGRGLAPCVYERVQYVLAPLEGYSDFNHLSVRSAAAIIFDRWLGMNVRAV